MDPKTQSKAKRRRKKESRTHVLISDSDSDPELPRGSGSDGEAEQMDVESTTSNTKADAKRSKNMSDKDVSAAFNVYYMQKCTKEFADDLDKIRVADDFHDSALPILVNALQQGTFLFSAEDQRRIVMAGTKG